MHTDAMGENRTMSNRRAIAMCLMALGLAGCATNVSQVRERGAADLNCDAKAVSVTLVERPYVGVTRYEAEGCGATKAYECTARLFSWGMPIGERTCRREGSGNAPTRPVVGDGGVAF